MSGVPSVESAGFVTVGGRDIWVRRSGTGLPLLLLSGMGMTVEMWAPLRPYLRRVGLIEADLPGTGERAKRANKCDRAWPPEQAQRGSGVTQFAPCSMRSYAALVRDLLDALEIDRADVLGLSFGGMIAQQLALDAPTRIRKLVLVSTSCGWGGIPSNPVIWSSRLFGAIPPSIAPASDPSVPRQTVGSGYLRSEFGVHGGRLPDPVGCFNQIVAASTWSSLPCLAGMRPETLIIAGSADTLVPPINAAILAAWVPRARSHIVSGGGHLCLLDRPDEVGPIVSAFLLESVSDKMASEYRSASS